MAQLSKSTFADRLGALSATLFSFFHPKGKIKSSESVESLAQDIPSTDIVNDTKAVHTYEASPQLISGKFHKAQEMGYDIRVSKNCRKKYTSGSPGEKNSSNSQSIAPNKHNIQIKDVPFINEPEVLKKIWSDAIARTPLKDAQKGIHNRFIRYALTSDNPRYLLSTASARPVSMHGTAIPRPAFEPERKCAKNYTKSAMSVRKHITKDHSAQNNANVTMKAESLTSGQQLSHALPFRLQAASERPDMRETSDELVCGPKLPCDKANRMHYEQQVKRLWFYLTLTTLERLLGDMLIRKRLTNLKGSLKNQGVNECSPQAARGESKLPEIYVTEPLKCEDSQASKRCGKEPVAQLFNGNSCRTDHAYVHELLHLLGSTISLMKHQEIILTQKVAGPPVAADSLRNVTASKCTENERTSELSVCTNDLQGADDAVSGRATGVSLYQPAYRTQFSSGSGLDDSMPWEESMAAPPKVDSCVPWIHCSPKPVASSVAVFVTAPRELGTKSKYLTRHPIFKSFNMADYL